MRDPRSSSDLIVGDALSVYKEDVIGHGRGLNVASSWVH